MEDRLDSVADLPVAADIIPTDPAELARRCGLEGAVLRTALARAAEV